MLWHVSGTCQLTAWSSCSVKPHTSHLYLFLHISLLTIAGCYLNPLFPPPYLLPSPLRLLLSVPLLILYRGAESIFHICCFNVHWHSVCCPKTTQKYRGCFSPSPPNFYNQPLQDWTHLQTCNFQIQSGRNSHLQTAPLGMWTRISYMSN